MPRAKRRSSGGRFGNVAHCSDSFRGDSRLPRRDCVGASPDKSREAKQGPLARFQTSQKAAKCEPQLHPDCDVAAGFSVPGTTISGQEERAASHVFFCFFFFFSRSVSALLASRGAQSRAACLHVASCLAATCVSLGRASFSSLDLLRRPAISGQLECREWSKSREQRALPNPPAAPGTEIAEPVTPDPMGKLV